MDKRKDWDHYFMDIAQVVAERANCSRRQIGSVIVCDKRLFPPDIMARQKGYKIVLMVDANDANKQLTKRREQILTIAFVHMQKKMRLYRQQKMAYQLKIVPYIRLISPARGALK